MSGKKSHIPKTNAMRVLDTSGVGYSVCTYEVDESDLSGAHVAALLGADPDTIFKTLVLEGDSSQNLVCCIPCLLELDLKKVAKESGNKRVEMIPMKNLFELTGYVRGGCSPLGMKKTFPTYIDESALLFDEVSISGGLRGVQVTLSPISLAAVVGAELKDLTK